MLQEKQKAPEFSLPDQDGNIHTLAQQEGKWTIIYFYPKDDTPGCTKEACAIRDVYNDFENLGVTVLGVSKDSPASHRKFREKYGLPFTLLSDESTQMMQNYGVWQEKSLFGKEFMGTVRASYLIAPDLTIAKVYPEVDPANHALELLNDLKDLKN